MAIDKKILVQTLNQNFNEGELRTLAFDLNINLEDLPGGGKTNMATEIVEFADRRGRLEDLAAFVDRLRTKLDRTTKNGQTVINVNIGNVGIGGNVSVGQSIHSDQIAGGEVNRDASKQAAIIEHMHRLLTDLRDSLVFCQMEAPEERELRYALQNVKELQAEISDPTIRPNLKLLLRRLKDNDYILDTARSRKLYSGKYLEEAIKASQTNKELIEQTMELSQMM